MPARDGEDAHAASVASSACLAGRFCGYRRRHCLPSVASTRRCKSCFKPSQGPTRRAQSCIPVRDVPSSPQLDGWWTPPVLRSLPLCFHAVPRRCRSFDHQCLGRPQRPCPSSWSSSLGRLPRRTYFIPPLSFYQCCRRSCASAISPNSAPARRRRAVCR
jgi:hypothetical protein